MSRARFVQSGDELIERCADCGARPEVAVKDRIPLLTEIDMTFPLFATRVRDAMVMLAAGESRQSVRARHGGVVLEMAEKQIENGAEVAS